MKQSHERGLCNIIDKAGLEYYSTQKFNYRKEEFLRINLFLKRDECLLGKEVR